MKDGYEEFDGFFTGRMRKNRGKEIKLQTGGVTYYGTIEGIDSDSSIDWLVLKDCSRANHDGQKYFEPLSVDGEMKFNIRLVEAYRILEKKKDGR